MFSNTLQVEGRSQNICLGRTLDVLKLLPSLCWGVMSFFAFPAYLSMGWLHARRALRPLDAALHRVCV